MPEDERFVQWLKITIAVAMSLYVIFRVETIVRLLGFISKVQ